MLKLLLATDGSPNAQRAAEHVAGLARRGIAMEVVLCNVQPPVMSGDVGVIAPVEIAERKRTIATQAAFEAVAGLLREAGVVVTLHEGHGDPAGEIVAAASGHRCDGIVLGRRGLGLLASMVLGSVSAQVVRAATLPVTLVK